MSHYKRHRFATWDEALHAVLTSLAGPPYQIRKCDECGGYHLFRRPLRYAHR